jgi:hypothetical protein
LSKQYRITAVQSDSSTLTYAVTAAPGMSLDTTGCCGSSSEAAPKDQTPSQSDISAVRQAAAVTTTTSFHPSPPSHEHVDTCNCGCSEDKADCGDCVQDGCLEYLLRPPELD